MLHASGWKLPPLDGELTGEFNAMMLGGAPKVKWKTTVHTEKPRERAVTFELAVLLRVIAAGGAPARG